jgi:hypothetical protein
VRASCILWGSSPGLGVGPEVLDLEQRHDAHDLLGAAEVERREQHLGEARLDGELCKPRGQGRVILIALNT